MRKIVWSTPLTLVLAGISTCVVAGSNAGELSRAPADLIKQARAEQRELAKSVSPDDVGDADSFGRGVVYIGLAQSGEVSLQADCTPAPGEPPLGPDDRCITLNPAPAATTFDERDIGRIHLPAKSTKSLICFAVTSFPLWEFYNPTATVANGTFRFNYGFTIENEVLDDPSAIDPNTGLPYGGVIELPFGSPVIDSPSIEPGGSHLQRVITSRHCIGGLLSKQALSTTYGLPDSLVERFFKKPTTIRLNMGGSMSFVDAADLLFGVRFYGD